MPDSTALLLCVPIARGQQELAEEHGAVQLEEGGCEQGLAQGRRDVFWHILSLRAEEMLRGGPCLKPHFGGCVEVRDRKWDKEMRGKMKNARTAERQ